MAKRDTTDNTNPNPDAENTTGSTTPPEGAPLADPENPYAGAEITNPGPLGGPDAGGDTTTT